MSHTRLHSKHPHPALNVAGLGLSRLVCMGMLAMLTQVSAQAQTVYRMVGPDGRVTFSDKPPVVAGKTSSLNPATPDTAAQNTALPYELRQIAGKYPVTLYTSTECAPCDEGRSLLRGRGVPFTEKTIITAEDAQSLKNLTDSTSLPLLTIGGQQLKGFSAPEWTQYLSAAGYPEKSRLPAGYRQPLPSPLVAVQTPATPAASTTTPPSKAPATQAPAAATRVTPSNPAGIQF